MVNNSFYSKILSFFEFGFSRVNLVKDKKNQGRFLHVSAPNNLFLDRITVTGDVKSARGNIKAIKCNLQTIRTPGNISLIDTAAKYLTSDGNVTIKHTDKIQHSIHGIWAKSFNIDNIKAKGRISAQYGNAVASRSSLKDVFGGRNVYLTDSSVEKSVVAGYGNITIKQSNGHIKTIGLVCSQHGQVALDYCHVKGMIFSQQHAFITNCRINGPIHLCVDPRHHSILDLTNTQVDKQVNISIGDRMQFSGEPPLGPLPTECRILVKGNVDRQKIKLTSTIDEHHDCNYNISYQQTAEGLLIQGKLEKEAPLTKYQHVVAKENECFINSKINSFWGEQTVSITNSKVNRLTFAFNPRREAILDLTNSQVKKISLMMMKDNDPLADEWSILIKGNVDPEKISSWSPYKFSYKQTIEGLRVHGTLEE